jgi:hypothetical protein
MPRNNVDELFSQLAEAELPVPAEAGVIARGRRRRRNARLITAAAGVAIAALAVSTASIVQHVAAGRPTSPATSRPAPDRSSSPEPPGRFVPPAGEGRLILGFTRGGKFVMARAGSTPTATLTGLTAVTSQQSQVTTDPAGGWVVTTSAGPGNNITGQPERLALVSSSGHVVPFGPVFSKRQIVSSIAVRPDGSAVAVAFTSVTGASHCMCSAAQITLIPTPGHRAIIRTWTLASTSMTIAADLSWTPGGTGLTYLPGGDETGGGFSTSGPVSLSTAPAGSQAPAVTSWPVLRTKAGCRINGGAWAAGQYLAVEACQGGTEELLPVNAVTGAHEGAAVTVQGWACATPVFSTAAGGSQVLLSYCGPQTETDGRFRRMPGSLIVAAWAGGSSGRNG